MTEEAARVLGDELERRGLVAPARLLLDAHRPLAPLIGSAATFLAPLIGAVAGRRGIGLVRLFETPDGIDALIARLDREAPEGGCRTLGS